MDVHVSKSDIEKEFSAERLTWLKKFSKKTGANVLFYGLFILVLAGLDNAFNTPPTFQDTGRVWMAALLLIVMAPFNAWLHLPYPPTRDKTANKIKQILLLKKTYASSALNEYIARISAKQVREPIPELEEHLRAFNWLPGDNLELRKFDNAYQTFHELNKVQDSRQKISNNQPLL